jgi:hypothetical protein
LKEARDAVIQHRTQAPDIDENAEGARAARQEMATQQAAFNKELLQSAVAQRFFTSEAQVALHPMNEQAQKVLAIQTGLAKWKLEHRDLANSAKDVQEELARLTAEAEHQSTMKHVADWMSSYEQFKDPLDKLIDDQNRLNRAYEEAVKLLRDQGASQQELNKHAKAHEKALAAAYGEAHKLWQEQFKSRQYSALVGGTSEAASALSDYRLGSTAIPKDMLENKKEQPKEDQMILGINRVADGVDKLIGIEKDRAKNIVEIPLANL